MSDAPITSGQHPRLVDCPECGEFFVARGLAAHRRMRHGVASIEVNEMAATLTRIAQVLERLETRLAPAESSQDLPPGEPPSALPSPSPVVSEMRVLECGLREILAEIARVKSDAERQIATWGGRAQTEDQKALEQTSYEMLGTLRRRQASLLFRLQEARGGDAVDNSLCT